ncbi:hypothetical protein BLA29_011619, partial [Euroglyphus maynei]
MWKIFLFYIIIDCSTLIFAHQITSSLNDSSILSTSLRINDNPIPITNEYMEDVDEENEDDDEYLNDEHYHRNNVTDNDQFETSSSTNHRLISTMNNNDDDDFCSDTFIDSAYFNGYDTILTRGNHLWYYYKDHHRLSRSFDQRRFTQ